MSDVNAQAGPFTIRSEAHGPHWVAWLAAPDGKPQDSVLLVGQTREEAETRAHAWADARAARKSL